MKFALFGSMFPDRTAKAEEQIFGVCEAIKRHGGELILPENFFLSLPGHIQQKVGPLCELAETLPQVDMVVSVGGDGTFLRTATTVGDSCSGYQYGATGFLSCDQLLRCGRNPAGGNG